ncbi:MAG: Rossmann-like and DUF2520 domain-containing protein [Bernardetiaceae bacterium]
MKRIAFVGVGNVGGHLAKALDAAGYAVVGIYARTTKKVEALAQELRTMPEVLETPDFCSLNPDLLILALPDAAYVELLPILRLPESCLLVHTSGSVPIEVLTRDHPKAGVLYPLQTFSAQKNVDFTRVLFCLEATQAADVALLSAVVKRLGASDRILNGADRAQLHLAAVFACNFSNLLWQISEELLQKNDMDISILAPLLQETLDKALLVGPRAAQTGPAIRRDHNILSRHLDLLQKTPYQDLYATLSELIQKI